MPLPHIGVVIVTMGTRPKELGALLESVAWQSVSATRVVVVGNSTPLTDVPGWVTKVPLAKNLGCPGGRNAGLRVLVEPDDVDVVIDLDDDGLLIADDVFARVQQLYAADPVLGIVSFRVADEQGLTLGRHVPRLGAGDPLRRGLVTTFLGGGHALSTRMLRQIGDWPEQFFFEHEETDLAWRALDGGWDIRYEPDLVLQHPTTPPDRHAVHYRLTARNRVWLARRRLPALLVPAYLGVWIAITLARTHSPVALRTWAAGFWEGVRTPSGPRQPMRWRTVWRMTRLGRPPVI
ncbi:MAG TPA: glycosyltransferase family 2 protein [Streptosporangiaceae bacterium]|nr:glycosyltransferase family 2 protein [Streptosporangiaceae bacterium]